MPVVTPLPPSTFAIAFGVTEGVRAFIHGKPIAVVTERVVEAAITGYIFGVLEKRKVEESGFRHVETSLPLAAGNVSLVKYALTGKITTDSLVNQGAAFFAVWEIFPQLKHIFVRCND